MLTGLVGFLYESGVKNFPKPKMLSNSDEIVLVASEVIVKVKESAVKALCGTWCNEDYSIYKYGLFEPTLIENNALKKLFKLYFTKLSQTFFYSRNIFFVAY